MDRLAELDQNLNRLMRYLRAALLRESEVSPSQFMVLKHLDQHRSPTMGELAEHLSCSLSAATAIVDRLVAAGYVGRRRDTNDRRVVRIHLTDDGAGLLQRAQQRRLTIFKRHFAHLSEPEFATLCALMSKLAAAAEAEAASTSGA